MPGRSSIRPTRLSDKKTTEQRLSKEVTAEEMLRSTSTGAASATSFESDLQPWPSSDPPVARMEPTGIGRITQNLNAEVDPPSTASHQNAWRFPDLLGIFNSCYHRWVSRRD